MMHIHLINNSQPSRSSSMSWFLSFSLYTIGTSLARGDLEKRLCRGIFRLAPGGCWLKRRKWRMIIVKGWRSNVTREPSFFKWWLTLRFSAIIWDSRWMNISMHFFWRFRGKSREQKKDAAVRKGRDGERQMSALIDLLERWRRKVLWRMIRMTVQNGGDDAPGIGTRGDDCPHADGTTADDGSNASMLVQNS